jgi:pimeloyl-ACP methyl ester carboxylesterase
VPEHPTTDIFRLRPEDVPSHLVHDLAVLAPHVPDPGTPEFLEFLVNDFHEMSSLARVLWERPYDPKLGRWLHRITVPTLLLYGEQDRITPVQQAAAWAALIPKAKVQIVKEAGHLVLDEQAEARKAVLDFLA